jgi:uncharacterized protein (TIGR00369 family)
MNLNLNNSKSRVKSFTWADPRKGLKPGVDIKGIDYLSGLKDGSIAPPPAANLIGYKIIEVGDGKTRFNLRPAEYHYNPFSVVHGGLITAILDSSMTAAVMTLLDEKQTCMTIEIKTHFYRPVTEKTGSVIAEGNTIHLGKRVAVAQGMIIDTEGNRYAHATSSCLIIDTKY